MVRDELLRLPAGAEMDEALRRVDAGTYGRPIGGERLAARPFARCRMACA